MVIAIIFIILGLLLVLKAFGIAAGVGTWSLIWGIILLTIGSKIMRKGGVCPMCTGMWYTGKMHQKFHEKMHGGCCDGECECECDHDHDKDGQDHH